MSPRRWLAAHLVLAAPVSAYGSTEATEQTYLTALGRADESAVEDGRLILRGDGAELAFRPADA